MMFRWVVCAAAAVALGGCQALSAIDSAAEPTELYTVTPKSTFDTDLPNVYWQLAVEAPVAAASLNTGRIAIQMTPTLTDYYAKVAWTDRAPLMVQTRIVDSFENTRKIVAVARESIGLRANYVLQPDLRNFEAMYFASVERCVRARADKVPKVVDAFDQALGSVIKRLVSWTLRTPPPRPPSDAAPYDIGRYRNPENALVDSENCPKGNDASMVPFTDE